LLPITEGGPPPYATTYLPLFVYRNGFEYLRYGYATLTMFLLTALIVYAQYASCGAGATGSSCRP
jgi:multiple sugar transport system permease protein